MITGSSLDELALALNIVEDGLAKGGRAKLKMVTTTPLGQVSLDEFQGTLVNHGFHLFAPVSQVPAGQYYMVQVPLVKGSPVWAMLIPLIPTILIVGLVAFGMVKIGEISKAILPIILATGGLIIVAVALARQPAISYIEKMPMRG